jgi:N-acetylglucosamine kinase-like BadF-type ATPase
MGPGANVATLDPRLTEERITRLLRDLSYARPAACCAGAAGAEVAEARARLESLLVRLLPGCRVCVVHDARLVLAAAGLDSGAALIAGTGSVAYGRAPDGREVQRGGWGWMIGDEGGGVWIAREAVRVSMTRADGHQPIGELGEALVAAAGAADLRDLIVKLHALHEPMQWAELAVVVFATADTDAGSRDIIHRAAKALVELAVPVRQATGRDAPVVLAGGLLLNQERLREAVQAMLPFPTVLVDEPPVEGAVRLAQQMLRG